MLQVFFQVGELFRHLLGNQGRRQSTDGAPVGGSNHYRTGVVNDTRRCVPGGCLYLDGQAGRAGVGAGQAA